MENEDNAILNTLSIMLTLAVKEAFPLAIWAGAGRRGCTAYCDVYLPKPFEQRLASEVTQQELRRLLANEQTIVLKEMLLGNAIDYLRHTKGMYPFYAEEQDPKEPVHVVEIDNRRLLGSAPVLASFSELAAAKIWQVELVDAEPAPKEQLVAIRFSAYAVLDTSQLPPLERQLESAQDCNHVVLGRRHGLFITPDHLEDPWLWLENGHAWKEMLVSVLNENLPCSLSSFYTEPLQDEISQEDFILSQNIRSIQSLLQSGHSLPVKTAHLYQTVHPQDPFTTHDGLFYAPRQTGNCCYILCNEESLEEELISSLQLIEKTYKIFPVECYWTLLPAKPKKHSRNAAWEMYKQRFDKAIQTCAISCNTTNDYPPSRGPQIVLQANDKIGRPWILASLTVDIASEQRINSLQTMQMSKRQQKHVLLHLQTMASLERIAAVILEHCTDNASLWLAPEQLRLMPAKNEYLNSAQHIVEQARQMGIRATVDNRNVSLQKRSKLAKRENVPFTAVVIGQHAGQWMIEPSDEAYNKKLAVPFQSYLKALHERITTAKRALHVPIIEE